MESYTNDEFLLVCERCGNEWSVPTWCQFSAHDFNCATCTLANRKGNQGMLENGTPVVFGDDLGHQIHGRIFQQVVHDPQLGAIYSVWEEHTGERYYVAEDALYVDAPDAVYELARCITLAATVGMFIFTLCGIVWMHSWWMSIGGGWLTLLGLIMTHCLDKAAWSR